MDARLNLAATLPPQQGMRGALSTILDVQRYKRAGFVTRDSAPDIVRMVMAARMEEQRSRGHGNRACRRVRAMIDRAVARLRDRARQRHTDILHDVASEGYSRRPLRVNPHD